MEIERFEHYLRAPSRQGPAPVRAFTGAAGGAACGDLSRISLRIEGGRVAAVTFDAEGCGAMRAASAAAAEMVDGAPVLDAARLGVDALHRALASAAASDARLADPASRRVLVAMSGGVDSAVAALLERER